MGKKGMLVSLVVLNLAYIRGVKGQITNQPIFAVLPKSAYKFRFVMQWYLKLDFYRWRHR